MADFAWAIRVQGARPGMLALRRRALLRVRAQTHRAGRGEKKPAG